jgi:Rod binding domain-containing protein
MIDGMPIIDQSLLPADVRDGSKADRKTYEAALGFEKALVTELTKAMAETAKPEDDEQQDAATSTYQSQMPDRIADSLMQAGGIGIARSLYDSIKEGGK